MDSFQYLIIFCWEKVFLTIVKSSIFLLRQIFFISSPLQVAYTAGCCHRVYQESPHQQILDRARSPSWRILKNAKRVGSLCLHVFGRLGLSVSSRTSHASLPQASHTRGAGQSCAPVTSSIFPANLFLSMCQECCWNLCLSNGRFCLLSTWGSLDQEPECGGVQSCPSKETSLYCRALPR